MARRTLVSKTPPTNLALQLSVEEKDSYWHIRATAVRYSDTEGLRSIGESDYMRLDGELRDIPGGELRGLQLSCQNSNDNARKGETSYGWRSEYCNIFSVDQRYAVQMASVLNRLAKKMEAVSNELGWPESFSAYVLRVAKCLGIKTFVVCTRAGRAFQFDGEYRALDASQAGYWMTDQERTYIDKHSTPMLHANAS
jgi:hypothetical protein